MHYPSKTSICTAINSQYLEHEGSDYADWDMYEAAVHRFVVAYFFLLVADCVMDTISHKIIRLHEKNRNLITICERRRIKFTP